MTVDSGASGHLVYDDLTACLRDDIDDYKKLKEPTIIVTAGKKEVLATTTGTICGYIIDQNGQRVRVRTSAMLSLIHI